MASNTLRVIRFTDLKDAQHAAVQQLKFASDDFDRREKAKTLTEIDKVERARIEELLRTPADSYDPLFVAVRAMLGDASTGLAKSDLALDNGRLHAPNGEKGPDEDDEIARAALILGLLQKNKAAAPAVKVIRNAAQPDPADPAKGRFAEAFFQAVGRVAGRMDLALTTLKVLASAVHLSGNDRAAEISTLDYARVFEKLIAAGVSAADPNLKRKVEENLDTVQNLGDERPLHEFEINLPDLEMQTANDVVEDNIRLMGPLIFASMFEELKAFQVVDKLIEMSQRGELPLIRGAAGTQLYSYWRDAPNRMSEVERQTFYAMTLGLPTGQPGVQPNRDFQDLWLRFVSSVSALVRESRVDSLLRAALPAAINQQQVKKAARDLAANMSLHGYGMAYYAAIDLQKQINDMITLLQDSELRSAFGARDMWGVIDQVAQTELGGAKNSSKYRMLATSGAIITNWLADNTARLRDPTAPMVDLASVANPPSRLPGQSAVSKPTDYDLVNACELWLADSAMGEDRVEQLSQPRESPQQTSRPIQIPSIARDLLEGTGLGLGMSFDQRPQNQTQSRANGAGSANGHSRYGSY